MSEADGVMTARAQEIRTGLARLHAADPVLAQVIDERPDFDPDAWARRLAAMDLFGALVFQVIGARGPCRARSSSLCSGPMSSGRTTLPSAISSFGLPWSPVKFHRILLRLSLVGHRTTIVTQKVCRHQFKLVISTGATAMNALPGLPARGVRHGHPHHRHGDDAHDRGGDGRHWSRLAGADCSGAWIASAHMACLFGFAGSRSHFAADRSTGASAGHAETDQSNPCRWSFSSL
jgi:hypothetical protein